MNVSAHARARARRYAMQALYQWDLSGTDLPLIRRQFLEAEDFSRADQAYFEELLSNIPESIDVVDKNISEFIDRPLQQLDPVERAILRIGLYELLSRQDIPYRVIINEAVQISKKFGAEQGHAFVNGVLDKAAHKVRAAECKQSGRKVAGH
ncbi:MAG TPA: transcription antitermination factor NusB [Gammaproteobacteria bacterium]|nr:transcription antitermination factor NusB [Gammaproteobacteria bacterium]